MSKLKLKTIFSRVSIRSLDIKMTIGMPGLSETQDVIEVEFVIGRHL